MSIRVIPLGAGQDVGKSCVLVSLGGKNIMFDCGMHMGFNDARRFPDFSFISKSGRFNELLDCVIVSHFHLDHCGALPFFTEMCGYDGPVYMTHPTKAICPILLEDYRKIMVERKGEQNFFTSSMIKACMRKVRGVSLHETVRVDDELEIKAYYAGHVLGAAMFHVRVGRHSVVYTGDYNMTPDRHLGAAWIDRCRPDVLITESTYATTVRDSKRTREADLLKKVQRCVEQGGKVLIPVFALGRAQELCVLLETYWDRVHLNVPIYFSAGLTEKANHYYRLFIGWTNQKIKRTFADRNAFDFRRIKPWHPSYFNLPGPMVLFATPGMLHQGTSLKAFQQWSADPRNMVILPGYCVAGTVGAKVLAGKKRIELDAFTTIEVNLQVENLSFSAHADAKGILQLIRLCEPRHVCLVHGERRKMEVLAKNILNSLNTPCSYPANGTAVTVNAHREIPVQVAKRTLLRDRLRRLPTALAELPDSDSVPGVTDNLARGIVLVSGDKNAVQFIDADGISQHDIEGTKHHVRYRLRIAHFADPVADSAAAVPQQPVDIVHAALEKHLAGAHAVWRQDDLLSVGDATIQFLARPTDEGGMAQLEVIWPHTHDALANTVVQVVRRVLSTH
ncbi:beta-lactamase-like protein [Thamnocephalis sphaerospora]|uniref:Beta-lactamase-like protein n=1 Tax=Thamnocephalis sphaerospora TaxID=78915 RepID=A0A4P9XKD1_9FUNG|nr:beta-lactamase-like protein [Thamnocephalis sphaerospora]|eukprot:RKP06257.1 beta-lactamase-like protein [Thamnocephalis sphaerospora]